MSNLGYVLRVFAYLELKTKTRIPVKYVREPTKQKDSPDFL